MRTKTIWLVVYPDDSRSYVSAWEPDAERMTAIAAQGGHVYPYVLPVPPDPEAWRMWLTRMDELVGVLRS